MADTIEFEAGTEREAVAKASEALGIGAEEVDYTVVDEGSDGMFGLGSRPVKIRVRPPEGSAEAAAGSEGESGEHEPSARRGPAPEKAAQADEVARKLLELMGVEARVTVRDDDEHIVVLVEEVEGGTSVAEVLGGSRPPAIPALQFLLNKIVNRFPDDRKHVAVDVPSVPKKPKRERVPKESAPSPAAAEAPIPTVDEIREAVDEEVDGALIEVGLELAIRARQLGRVLTVHPMLPPDRRAIHQTVMQVPGVQTVSEGEGLYRRIHIVPDALARSGGGGSKRRRRRRGARKGNRPAPNA